MCILASEGLSSMIALFSELILHWDSEVEVKLCGTTAFHPIRPGIVTATNRDVFHDHILIIFRFLRNLYEKNHNFSTLPSSH